MAHVILWNCNPTHNEVPRPTRVLGPYQLASWLRQQGYVVKVIDFCNSMTLQQLVDITARHIEPQTLTIGASSTFWSNSNSYARTLNGNGSQLPTWVTLAKQVLSESHAHLHWSLGGTRSWMYDAKGWTVFHGHAEDEFVKWLDHLSGITHIARQTFDIKHSCKTFDHSDHIDSHEVLPVELGRGCMFRCKFCAYDLIGKTPGTYLRGYDHVKQEILDHHDRWGTTRFYYVDDTVNESVEKVQALAKIAQSMPFDLEWIGYVRADLISSHPETEQLLLESGMKSPFIGIESFEERSSSLVGKGWSGKHGKDWLLRMRQQWGTAVTWQLGLIIGLPGQTTGQLQQDHQWLMDNDMHSWRWAPLWLAPGKYQSEFSLNSNKHGFAFPDANKPWHWVNAAWDWESAQQLAIDMNSNEHGRRAAAWMMGDIASLGYAFDHIMSPYISDLPWKEINGLRQIFLDRYVNSHTAV